MGELILEKTYSEEYIMPSGKKFVLPIHYTDWRCIDALFTVDASKVRTLIPSDKLKPLLLSPGRALITFMGMEYHEIDQLAPYNEFMIAVFVQYEPSFNIPGWPALFHPLYHPRRYNRFGVYIHRLPVTTEEAREGGVEGYGFPKTINDISFTDGNGQITCDLRTDGTHELTLTVKETRVKRHKIVFYSWSVKDGHLLFTPVETIGDYGIRRMPGGASLTLGEGPIAQELKELEIGKLAVGAFNGSNIQSFLHAPKELFPLS